MTTQKIAFVGCGGITEHYLNVYRQLDWVTVVTCIDTDLERAERAAQILSGGQTNESRVTANYEDALNTDVETVIINTPNHLHLEQSLAAFAAGKNVLLQKPLAPNVADGEEIAIAAALARANFNSISGLYLSYFDQPLMHDLRRMNEAGWFGDIVHLSARLMHRGGMSWSEDALNNQKSSWRNSRAQTGGGCFIQLAIHYIHLFEWITRQKIVRVSAQTRNLHCPGLEGEDLAAAILEFDSGALATIDAAWNTQGEQIAVRGTKGSAEYINNRILLLESDAGAFRGDAVRYAPIVNEGFKVYPGSPLAAQTTELFAPALDDYTNPFNQHRLFLEAVRDRRQPFASVQSGVRDLRIVEAVYQSARTGKPVEIREPENQTIGAAAFSTNGDGARKTEIENL